ncbi:hypothetical protein ACP70R_003787 [Stipagrostis hirtigluma subsp. patula]
MPLPPHLSSSSRPAISVCLPLPDLLLMAAGGPRGMAAVGWDETGPSRRMIPSPSSLSVILLLVTTPSHLPPAISTLLPPPAGDPSKQEADPVPPRSGLAQRRLSVR